MEKGETVDLGLILIWPLIAVAISFLFRPNSFISVLLFLTIPAIYLSFRGKQYVKKILLFSVVTTIPLMIVIDYISHLTGDWVVMSSIIPYRLFGFVTVEVLLWALSTCYFIIIFYEYFIDKHNDKKAWHSRMKLVVVPGIVVLLIFLALLFFAPGVLNVSYFYFTWGILILLIPFLVQMFVYPKTTMKFFYVGIYFFYLHFLYEITAVSLNWWTFPGKFVGWINIFGIGFPIEELFFWFILLALTTLSYWEFFDDDEK